MMFRMLKPEEVEVRVAQCSDKGCSLLLYKTARTDANLLDETVGPENWQNRYHSIDGKLFCDLALRCDGEWVWKSDTGTESNMEAQKGEASDAFKRAGFRWGIGRELYTAPRIWVGPDKCRLKAGKNGRMQCFDDFRVTEMEVEDGRIAKLTICNMSMKGAVVYGAKQSEAKMAPVSDDLQMAKAELWRQVQGFAKRTGSDPMAIMEGVKKRPEWAEQCNSSEYLMAVAGEFRDA